MHALQKFLQASHIESTTLQGAVALKCKRLSIEVVVEEIFLLAQQLLEFFFSGGTCGGYAQIICLDADLDG